MVTQHQKLGILAIGTELTDGQIANTNARWLAEKLGDLGAETPLHVVVPDERGAILRALSWMASQTSFLVVTGGLGPTSDDFTRDVIAEWTGLQPEYHAESWAHIEGRLSSMGVRIAEANRQQCFYPQGSRVYFNAAGTANGFSVKHPGLEIPVAVLPGPPREIAAIWETPEFQSYLKDDCGLGHGRPPERLETYQCLGKSEAELGEIVETSLAGSNLRRGYRAFMPFVEIKLWVPETLGPSDAAVIERFEEAIRPWVASRNGLDLGLHYVHSLGLNGISELYIADESATGSLTERLLQSIRKDQIQSLQPSSLKLFRGETTNSSEREILNLTPTDSTLRHWVLKSARWDRKWEWALPFQVPSSGKDRAFAAERAYRVTAEMALARLVHEGESP